MHFKNNLAMILTLATEKGEYQDSIIISSKKRGQEKIKAGARMKQH